jgi:hypothetical protein
MEFAKQVVTSYRKVVRAKRGLIARRSMIEAYLCAKRYERGIGL